MHVDVKVSELLPRVIQLAKLTKRNKDDETKGKVVLSVVEEGLRLDAVDNYVSMLLVVPVLKSDVGGAAVVDIKALLELLKKIKKENVSIVDNGDSLAVSSGRSKFKLKCFDIDSVPVLNHDVSNNASASISSAKLYTLFDRVRHASEEGKNVNRLHLAGVYLHTEGSKLVSVATNGARLARHAVSCDSLNIPDGIMIPNDGVENILGFLDTPDHPVNISIGSGKLSLTDENGQVVVGLLESKFPDYKRSLPEMINPIELDADELRNALLRAKYVVDESQRVLISGENGTLYLEAESEKGSSFEVVSDIENDSAPIPKIFVNRSYLYDALQCEAVVEFKDATSPILIKGLVDKEYKAIIMPMGQ